MKSYGMAYQSGSSVDSESKTVARNMWVSGIQSDLLLIEWIEKKELTIIIDIVVISLQMS